MTARDIILFLQSGETQNASVRASTQTHDAEIEQILFLRRRRNSRKARQNSALCIS